VTAGRKSHHRWRNRLAAFGAVLRARAPSLFEREGPSSGFVQKNVA